MCIGSNSNDEYPLLSEDVKVSDKWKMSYFNSGMFPIDKSITKNGTWAYYNNINNRYLGNISYEAMVITDCSKLPDYMYICSEAIGICLNCKDTPKIGLQVL